MQKVFKYFSVVFFLISFLLMSKVIFNDSFPDFRSYYFNPLMSLHGQNPYFANINLFTPSVYPPFLFLFFTPLTFLPFEVVQKAWIILSIPALLVSLYLIFKLYSKKIFLPENLILSSLVFLSFPTKFTLGMGQINMFILLLLALFLFSINKSKVSASLFLGLSILLKIFPVFIFIYFILKRKWRVLLLTLLTVLLGVFFTFILIKPEVNLYFYQKVFPTLVDSWKGDYYNQSLSGLIVRANVDPASRALLRNIITLFILSVSFYAIFINKFKDKLTQNLELGIIITLNLLLNSFSWQHHFVWLVIPFFTTYFFIKKMAGKKQVLTILLAICYLLISINLKSPQSFPVILQSHVFYGTLLLLMLEFYLLVFQKKPAND